MKLKTISNNYSKLHSKANVFKVKLIILVNESTSKSLRIWYYEKISGSLWCVRSSQLLPKSLCAEYCIISSDNQMLYGVKGRNKRIKHPHLLIIRLVCVTRKTHQSIKTMFLNKTNVLCIRINIDRWINSQLIGRYK